EGGGSEACRAGDGLEGQRRFFVPEGVADVHSRARAPERLDEGLHASPREGVEGIGLVSPFAPEGLEEGGASREEEEARPGEGSEGAQAQLGRRARVVFGAEDEGVEAEPGKSREEFLPGRLHLNPRSTRRFRRAGRSRSGERSWPGSR